MILNWTYRTRSTEHWELAYHSILDSIVADHWGTIEVD